MAKSSVSTMVTRLKRRIDYNIQDTDLDNLLVDCINDALKLINQWLYDAGMYVDISSSATLTMVASQGYIDISTALADLNDLIVVRETTNDKTVEIIPYSKFAELYPDATANKSSVPDHCALLYNRLYIAPTPSANGSIYVEYTTIPSDITLVSTLPYKTKFDPLVLATSRTEYLRYFDKNNTGAIRSAEQVMEYYKNQLITKAAKNLGQNNQTLSRDEVQTFFPKAPLA